MRDPRIDAFAQTIVGHATGVQQGDRVLIEMVGAERDLVQSLIAHVYALGGEPYVQWTDRAVLRTLIAGMGRLQLETWRDIALHQMRQMDVYIGIRAGENANELSGIPSEAQRAYEKIWYHPVHLEQRVKHTRWVVMRYPNAAMAQQAGMNTDAFADFYFSVCNIDYARLSRAMDALVARMEATDRVRIIGPGTDVSFSIRGMNAVKCCGHRNLPDGEVFTAPIRDSVEGTIAYNVPSVHAGTTFEHVRFRFDRGRIVEAHASDTARLHAILDTDDGARYIGEWSLGFHPYILHPMKDTLFDEKIAGSLHMTPGQAYEEADNGNRSAIHWDLVLIQRPEYGGGQVWFDDTLIRHDGEFVVDDLHALNRGAWAQ
ncbi:MAG: aminopeptidase [Paenibacillaceae bacterium]|nr:aminopeptidase [Paenibacillaceae bacterium]